MLRRTSEIVVLCLALVRAANAQAPGTFLPFPEINVSTYGAVGDAQVATGCNATVSTTTTVSCSSNPFASADVGKAIQVSSAGPSQSSFAPLPANLTWQDTISQVQTSGGGSCTSGCPVAVLTTGATVSATGVTVTWGTDNTAAFQTAANTCPNASPSTGLTFLSKGCVLVVPNPGGGGTGDYLFGCANPMAGQTCAGVTLSNQSSFQLAAMGNSSKWEQTTQAGVRLLTAMPMVMFTIGQAGFPNSGSFQISNLTFKDTSGNGSAIGAIHAIATNEAVFAYDSFEDFDGYQPDPTPGVPDLSYAIRMDTGPPPSGSTTIFNNNNFLLHVKGKDNSVFWDDTINSTGASNTGNDGPVVISGDIFPDNLKNPGACYGFRSFGQARFFGTHFDVSSSQAANISSASRSGNVVTVTTMSNHNLLPGTVVTISGLTGSGVNGTFPVCGPPTSGCASPTATTFTYQSGGTGAISGTGTAQASCVALFLTNSGLVSAKFESSGMGLGGNGIEALGGGAGSNINTITRQNGNTTVHVTTSSSHGLVVGENVIISSVPSSVTNFNGSFTVTKVESSTVFDYDQSASSADTENGGTASGSATKAVSVDSFFASTLNNEVTLDPGSSGISIRDTSASTAASPKVTDNGSNNNVFLTRPNAGLLVSGGATGANFDINQAQNGGDVILSKRNTDTSPTGNFLHFQTAGGTDLVTFDVNGAFTSTVSAAASGAAGEDAITATAGTGGGASSGTAGTGGGFSLTGGAGGAQSGGSGTTGGPGGSFTLTVGDGGSVGSGGTNGSGGDFSVTLGAVGTGGSNGNTGQFIVNTNSAATQDISDFESNGTVEFSFGKAGTLTTTGSLIDSGGTVQIASGTPTIVGSATSAPAFTLQGTVDGTSNFASSSGSLTVRGGNYTGTGGKTAMPATVNGGDATGASGANVGGALTLRGGNVSSSSASAVAGSVTIQGGGCTAVTAASTCNGQVKVLQEYFTTGTAAVNDLACVTAVNTVASCPSTTGADGQFIGVIDSVSGNTVYVASLGAGGTHLFNATSATFTNGHFVCQSAASENLVVDSGSTCTHGEGVGIYIGATGTQTTPLVAMKTF